MKSALAVAMLGVLLGCGDHHQMYSSPGTFFVQYLERRPENDYEQLLDNTTIIRNGRIIGHDVLNLIVPRDRPDRALRIDVASSTAQRVQGGKPYHIDACRDPYNSTAEYDLSPDGLAGLCMPYFSEELYLFDPSGKRLKHLVDKNFHRNAGRSFAWIDSERFAVTLTDRPSCPYTDIYDDFPTRLVIFSRSGRRISQGPCVVGIVAGRHRVAYVSEAPNSFAWHVHQFFADDPRFYNEGLDRTHHVWSVDGGKTWRDGIPIVFDGNDKLLYEDEGGSAVYSEDGAVAFAPAAKVQWAR